MSGPARGPRLASASAFLVLIAAACSPQGAGAGSTPTIASPSSTGAAASTVPSAKPSTDPAAAAIEAFIAFASDPDASYQATFTGSSRHTVDVLPISKGVLQVSGGNVLVKATFRFPSGSKVAVEHRSVGGKGWVRVVPNAWERLSGFGPAQSMAAFPAVTGPADVTYLGPVEVAGKTAYQLRVRSAILNPVMIPASNLTDVVVTGPKFTVVVDARGRPIGGQAETIGNGRVSGQLQEIAIDLDVTFAKVGQPVTIKAP